MRECGMSFLIPPRTSFVRLTLSKNSTAYGCPPPGILSQPSMQKRRRHVQRPLPAGWKTRNWTTFSQGIMRALPSGQRVRALPQRPRVCTSVTNWSLPLLASAPDIGARCQAAITLSSWRLTGCLTVKSTMIPPAEGGEDRIENAACLCPSHHREVHHGNQRSVLEAQLKELRAVGSGEPRPST